MHGVHTSVLILGKEGMAGYTRELCRHGINGFGLGFGGGLGSFACVGICFVSGSQGVI